MMKSLLKDPFRLFFPIGWCLALYGVSLWALFRIQWVVAFPSTLHARFMLGGFLFCFIAGFLMTAIPRFTETEFAKPSEMLVALLICIGLAASSFIPSDTPYYAFQAAGYILIAVFGARRFLRRKANPPDSFIFVGFGIALGLGCCLLMILSIEESFAKALYFQGVVLSLIIGVGSRLVPGIFGWTEIVSLQKDRYEQPKPFLQVISKAHIACLLVFAASYPIEFFSNQAVGLSLRALVVSYVAIKFWRLFQLPKKRTVHTYSLWVACWFILIGLWLNIFWPNIHTNHMVYVGGFGGIALMVATRVTLAHSVEGLGLESKKNPLAIIAFFIFFAAVSRASAHMLERSYLNHLAYAAVLWIIALGYWGIIFLPKIYAGLTEPEKIEE